jgi:hypothetical protein
MKEKMYSECFNSLEGYLLQEQSIFHSPKYKNKIVILHELLQMQRAVSRYTLHPAAHACSSKWNASKQARGIAVRF